MIQLLLIGRLAPQWAARLAQRAHQAQLEIHQARLPAEGVRRLEHTPPDVVMVMDEAHGTRARSLVRAIRQRPLGQILPILVLCEMPAGADAEAFGKDLGVEAWLPPDSPVHTVVTELARILGLEVGDLQPPLPPVPPKRQDHDDFIVEDISGEHLAFSQDAQDPPPSVSERPTLPAIPPAPPAPTPAAPPLPPDFELPIYPVERVDRHSLFPVRGRRPAGPGQLDETEIQRKLREVRHEDYFTILEVRLGSEGPILRQAYQRLMSRFDPEQLDFELTRRFFPELEEIRDAFEDAWAVLGDPHLRQRYIDAHMGRPTEVTRS